MAIESKKRIFITGGTGYIGGSFLHLMWERNYLENFDIRVLVRNIRTAEKLSQLGFTAAIGSLDDAVKQPMKLNLQILSSIRQIVIMSKVLLHCFMGQ